MKYPSPFHFFMTAMTIVLLFFIFDGEPDLYDLALTAAKSSLMVSP